MTLGPRPQAVRPPPALQLSHRWPWTWTVVASVGLSLHGGGGALCSYPAKGPSVSVRKARGGDPSALGLPPCTPGPPRRLWQILRCRCRNPGASGPRSLPPPSGPSAHREVRGSGGVGRPGRLGRGAGSQSREGRHATQARILFRAPIRVVAAGWARPATHASYFLPVRWMCWKRVMEKAMPRICMMSTHIPTVPSTCLLSSNHIFTFS